MSDHTQFVRADAIFQSFLRGDAMIGLVADVPAAEREMMDALWTAASEGVADAYQRIGDCYFAWLSPMGAFEGIDPADADGRSWSSEAGAVEDEDEAVQAALRGYYEAARLGSAAGLGAFARVARHSTEDNQRRALALLDGQASLEPADVYLRGLVLNWLGELEASAKAHHEAAAAGDADAAFELYVLYAQGLGVEPNEATSNGWLDKAAALGHARALYSLGASYASGKRGEPDMGKAAEHYRRAAEVGHGRAAATLAMMILQADVDGSEADAIRWLDTAEESGFPAFELLDAVGLADPRD